MHFSRRNPLKSETRPRVLSRARNSHAAGSQRPRVSSLGPGARFNERVYLYRHLPARGGLELISLRRPPSLNMDVFFFFHEAVTAIPPFHVLIRIRDGMTNDILV